MINVEASLLLKRRHLFSQRPLATIVRTYGTEKVMPPNLVEAKFSEVVGTELRSLKCVKECVVADGGGGGNGGGVREFVASRPGMGVDINRDWNVYLPVECICID